MGKRIGFEEPGGFRGAEYSWMRFDPHTGEQTPMPAPEPQVRFAGRIAVALTDGSVRLVDDPAALAPPRPHPRGVLAVGIGPDTIAAGGLDGVRVYDRAGQPLAFVRWGKAGMAELVVGRTRMVTVSRHHSAQPATAVIRDPASAEARFELVGGDGYHDLMTCDPTGSRVAFTIRGVLHLRELSDGEAGPSRALPASWHWQRRHAWSPAGDRLALVHVATAATVRRLDTGERERILTTEILYTAHLGVSEAGDLAVVDHSNYALRAIGVTDGIAGPSMVPGFLVTASASVGARGVVGGVEGGFWFDRERGTRQTLIAGRWVHACAAAGELGVLAGIDEVVAVALADGSPRWRWACPGRTQRHVAIAGDAVVCLDEQGRLTTLVAGAPVLERELGPGVLARLDADAVLFGGDDGVVARIDPRDGERLASQAVAAGAIRGLSAGGGRVCVGVRDSDGGSTWLLVDAALDGGPVRPLALPVEQAILTPDGERVVALERVARLDLVDARAAALIESRPFGAWPPAASPVFVDDRLEARERAWTGDAAHQVRLVDGAIEIWAGERRLTRWVDEHAWTCAALEGDRVVAGSRDGAVGIWALRR